MPADGPCEYFEASSDDDKDTKWYVVTEGKKVGVFKHWYVIHYVSLSSVL